MRNGNNSWRDAAALAITLALTGCVGTAPPHDPTQGPPVALLPEFCEEIEVILHNHLNEEVTYWEVAPGHPGRRNKVGVARPLGDCRVHVHRDASIIASVLR